MSSCGQVITLPHLTFRVQIKPLLKSAIAYNLGNMANGQVNGLADAANYLLIIIWMKSFL